MRVGFSGTRQGMTKRQKKVVGEILEELGVQAVNHGDCLGADADFHQLALDTPSEPHIYIYPGHNKTGKSPTRAYCDGPVGRLSIYAEAPYLQRNMAIIDNGDVFIATPAGYDELYRGSGTWHAIRYARRHDVARYIVYYDGVVDVTGPRGGNVRVR